MEESISSRGPNGSVGTAADTLRIRRITWIGLGINLFLAIVKFIGGFLGSSQAVIADAVHSLSDMATDFAVLFGVNYWSAPADMDHPYGHWRIETLISAVMGITLVAVALGIGYKSLATLREVHQSQPGWIAIVGVAFSIVLKEALYRRTLRIGKATKSSALVANAWHHRSDALSSIPALLAVAAAVANPHWAFVDHVGALIVALIILKVSWDIIRPAFSELIDRGATERELVAIQELAMKTAGVKNVHAIRSRRSGAGFLVDLHIQVNGDMTVSQGHEISRIVKGELLNNGPNVVDVMVHLEPYEKYLRIK